MEFIDSKNLKAYDETADSMIKEMEKHKMMILELIGQAKYDEELEVLKKQDKLEAKKGQFKAEVGAVDDRDKSLTADPLSSGFDSMCGVKGGKLSGGQK